MNALITRAREAINRGPVQPGATSQSPANPGVLAASTHQWPDPAKPSALLIPRHIRENRLAAVTRRKMTSLVVAVACLSVLAAAGAIFANQAALTEAEDAKTQAANVQAQVDDLSPIAAYYDGLQNRRQATATALANDITHDDLLTAVLDAMPGGVNVTAYTTQTGTPCASPDPFVTPARAVLGCLQVSGRASNETQVAQAVGALSTSKTKGLLADPFVSSISDNDGVEFAISVNFTDKALSNRFAPDTPTPADAATDGAATDSTTLQDGAQ